MADADDVFDIVAHGESPKAIKETLKARFGSFEKPAEVWRFHWLQSEYHRLNGTAPPLPEGTAGIEEVWANILRHLVAQLQEVDRWRTAAKQSPEAYGKALDAHLGQIKRAMNTWFGIEAHRPRENEGRDFLIFELKSQHPDWSFGMVAKEYRRITKQPINPKDEKSDAKWAQLIYKKRCEQYVDELIRTFRPDFTFSKLFEGGIEMEIHLNICQVGDSKADQESS